MIISDEHMDALLRLISTTVVHAATFKNQDPQPVIPVNRYEFRALQAFCAMKDHPNVIVQPPAPEGAPKIGLWIYGAWVVRNDPANPLIAPPANLL